MIPNSYTPIKNLIYPTTRRVMSTYNAYMHAVCFYTLEGVSCKKIYIYTPFDCTSLYWPPNLISYPHKWLLFPSKPLDTPPPSHLLNNYFSSPPLLPLKNLFFPPKLPFVLVSSFCCETYGGRSSSPPSHTCIWSLDWKSWI